jgi:hypothetical protein
MLAGRSAAFFMPQECAERLALRPGDVAAVLDVFDRNDRGDSRSQPLAVELIFRLA